MDIDPTALTDEQLADAIQQLLAERERRHTLHAAAQRADDLAQQWADAIGRQDGDQWRQPQAAFDAYPVGAVVTHNGKTWESTTPANVWEPGVSGWREQPATDPDTGEQTIPDYRQPTGGHDAYKTGDRVTWNGAIYESTIDGNVWSPDAYPDGWQLVP